MAAFPESYDELAVLAHHGATDSELARRLAEREQMGLEERYHSDLAARSHVGPTLADHRARWADGHSREADTPPARPADDGETDDAGDDPAGEVPSGTALDVLGWVGDDRTRARQALDAETGRDSPRTSLIAKLQRLADA